MISLRRPAAGGPAKAEALAFDIKKPIVPIGGPLLASKYELVFLG